MPRRLGLPDIRSPQPCTRQDQHPRQYSARHVNGSSHIPLVPRGLLWGVVQLVPLDLIYLKICSRGRSRPTTVDRPPWNPGDQRVSLHFFGDPDRLTISPAVQPRAGDSGVTATAVRIRKTAGIETGYNPGGQDNHSQCTCLTPMPD